MASESDTSAKALEGVDERVLKSGVTLFTVDAHAAGSLTEILSRMKRAISLNPTAYVRIRFQKQHTALRSAIKKECIQFFDDRSTFPFFEIGLVPHAGSLEAEGAAIDKVIFPFMKSIPDSDRNVLPKIVSALMKAYYTSPENVIYQDPIYGFIARWLHIETYKSGRVKTQMPFIETEKYVKIPEDISNAPLEGYHDHPDLSSTHVDDNLHVYIPVIRYQHGMSRGGYYTDAQDDHQTDHAKHAEPKKWCGTFYYLEPGSSTFLRVRTYTVFRNKYDAYCNLKKLVPFSMIQDDLSALYDNPDFDPIIFKVFAHYDRVYFEYTSQVLKLFISTIAGTRHLTLDIFYQAKELFKDYMLKGRVVALTPYIRADPITGMMIDDHSHTSSYIDQAYADEDRFDQVICLLAKTAGIDCLILTHMAGKTRIVSEVLDTRSRTDSFDNVYRLKTRGKDEKNEKK